MTTKSRNKYGRGNLQLMPAEKVYIPTIKADDELSYLSLSGYLILAGLVKGDRNQRKHILNSIKDHVSSYFYYKQFPVFLLEVITQWLKEDIDQQITPEMLLDQIFEFYPKVWGYEPKWRCVRDQIYVFCQWYYMEYRPEDIDRAIEVGKKHQVSGWPPQTLPTN